MSSRGAARQAAGGVDSADTHLCLCGTGMQCGSEERDTSGGVAWLGKWR
jgi:hypothetical protein